MCEIVLVRGIYLSDVVCDSHNIQEKINQIRYSSWAKMLSSVVVIIATIQLMWTNCFKFSVCVSARAVLLRVPHRYIGFFHLKYSIRYLLIGLDESFARMCVSPLNMLAQLRGKEAPTEWARSKTIIILSMCSIIYFLIFCTHISLHAAWDSFRFIHIPHEIALNKTFAAANFLIVCWNSDESITHRTHTRPNTVLWSCFDSSVFGMVKRVIVFSFLSPCAVLHQ